LIAKLRDNGYIAVKLKNMSESKWNSEEFLTYLMLYAAKTDGQIEYLETKDISDHHGEELTARMWDEIQGDTDQEAENKIKSYASTHDLSKKVDEIMYELDRVFFVNGSYEYDEVDRFIQIRRLLTTA